MQQKKTYISTVSGQKNHSVLKFTEIKDSQSWKVTWTLFFCDISKTKLHKSLQCNIRSVKRNDS